jgi:hypothetical protein
LLHDPAFTLAEADRAFVRRHIPWTGLLLDSGNERGGEALRGEALREQALKEPEAWALKPLDGHGGNGVVLGWTATAAEWASAVENAGHHVLQRRIAVERGPFYDVRAGKRQQRLVDLGPFLARGRLAGFLCRLSNGPLANVATGASQVPVFVDLAS